MAVVESVITWASVGLLRVIHPATWHRYAKTRRWRLFIVAVSAAVVATISGVAQGLTAVAIAKGALVAFCGAVTLRQTTKMQPPTLEYRSQQPDIRTRPPGNRYNSGRPRGPTL